MTPNLDLSEKETLNLKPRLNPNIRIINLNYNPLEILSHYKYPGKFPEPARKRTTILLHLTSPGNYKFEILDRAACKFLNMCSGKNTIQGILEKTKIPIQTIKTIIDPAWII